MGPRRRPRDHQRRIAASEWAWATRFEDAEEHTTRGLARVVGDATAYAERVLAGAEQREDRLHVTDAEADGELLHLTVSTSSDGNALSVFYGSMPEVLGPGVPLGS